MISAGRSDMATIIVPVPMIHRLRIGKDNDVALFDDPFAGFGEREVFLVLNQLDSVALCSANEALETATLRAEME